MNEVLFTYLTSMQAAAHRVERILAAVDALMDIPSDEARDQVTILLQIAQRQAKMLNQSLDSSAVARVQSLAEAQA